MKLTFLLNLINLSSGLGVKNVNGKFCNYCIIIIFFIPKKLFKFSSNLINSFYGFYYYHLYYIIYTIYIIIYMYLHYSYKIKIDNYG